MKTTQMTNSSDVFSCWIYGASYSFCAFLISFRTSAEELGLREPLLDADFWEGQLKRAALLA